MKDGLSIVIPSHGRMDLIVKLLQSIVADAERVAFLVEIILVDDTPLPQSDLIARAAADHKARVLIGCRHVGEKRNRGLDAALYDFVLFLDSDVSIRPGTLNAHYRALHDAPQDVAGCLGKVEFVGERTYAWEVIESMQLTLPFSYPDVAEEVPWGPTANISFRRGAFLQVGGFDTTLPHYGGEDVDIGLRLSSKGFRIITAPNAVAEHSIETWSTWRQNLSRLWSFGLADYHLLLRHPQRSFVDFPTAPMLWLGQAMVLVLLLCLKRINGEAAAGILLASIAVYPVVYSVFKQKNAQCSHFHVHLLGPLIFWTMDVAKCVEAVRQGRPAHIFRRLKFLDDLIAQDWTEIAASAWGLTGSVMVFLCVFLLFH